MVGRGFLVMWICEASISSGNWHLETEHFNWQFDSPCLTSSAFAYNYAVILQLIKHFVGNCSSHFNIQHCICVKMIGNLKLTNSHNFLNMHLSQWNLKWNWILSLLLQVICANLCSLRFAIHFWNWAHQGCCRITLERRLNNNPLGEEHGNLTNFVSFSSGAYLLKFGIDLEILVNSWLLEKILE